MRLIIGCVLSACLGISGAAHASTIAISDLDTVGNQAYTAGLGMDFDVLAPGGVDVTALGYFDHLRDGITSSTTIHVSIFDRVTSAELLRVAFDRTNPGVEVVGGGGLIGEEEVVLQPASAPVVLPQMLPNRQRIQRHPLREQPRQGAEDEPMTRAVEVIS